MPTRVVFRKFRDNGSIIALFPQIPWDVWGNQCASYMHVGQHSGADPHLSGATVPAKPAEYAPLLRELKKIGYRGLVVGMKVTRQDDQIRMAAAAKNRKTRRK